jgi:hypothetical protein
MLTLEEYNRLCTELLSNRFDPSYIIDYDSIKNKWDEMMDININKSQTHDYNSKNLRLSYLFWLRWGITALATSNRVDEFPLVFGSIFSSISNN